MRPRTRKMSETVDTSTKDIVRPHQVSQQSRLYNNELPQDNEELLRFDIPWDAGNKVGFRWNESVKVYRDDNKLYFSVLPLHYQGDLLEYDTPIFLSKYNGDPTSEDVWIEIDDCYTLIPREFIPQWNPYDDMTITYVHETDEEERHLEVIRG